MHTFDYKGGLHCTNKYIFCYKFRLHVHKTRKDISGTIVEQLHVTYTREDYTW